MTGRDQQNASGCWSWDSGDIGDVYLVALAAEERAGRSLLLQALTKAGLQCHTMPLFGLVRIQHQMSPLLLFQTCRRHQESNVASDSECRGYTDIFGQV